MTSAVRVALNNPFPGLRPFLEGEEHLFFGRESQVDMMIDKLAPTRFLAVVGTSGSGKSSLVNCGLRPALHRGLMAKAGTSWRIAQFRPESDPLKCMSQALAKDRVLFSGFESGGLALEDMIEATLRMSSLGLVDVYEQARLDQGVNLLLIVDQFEELFRYRSLRPFVANDGQDRSQEATAFVHLLLEAKAQTDFPIYIVLTMRSDFLGDCAEFAGLPEAINEGQYLVPRLTREERKAAITGPVRVGGGKASPVLLTRLVNDVGDNPDQLSILQHALNRTWARWQHEEHGEGELELAPYEAIGTMARALDQHAEKVYSELGSERQKRICEKIFKALTDKVTDSRGVRRPSRFSILCALADATPDEVTQVIDVFRKPSRSFLMPPLPEALEADTVVDISHESLMRVWERLKVWAEEEAQSAQVFRRLVETATLHAKGNAGLYRNPDLQLALKWREKENPTETWASLCGGDFELAMGFLAKSEAQQDEEKRDQEERQRRELQQAQALASAEEQARAARGLRRLAVALAIVFFIAVMSTIIAIQRFHVAEVARRDANTQRQRAEGLERKESAERLAQAAVDNIDVDYIHKDPELAVLLAQQAAQATYGPYKTLTPAAEDALRRSLQALRLQLTIPIDGGSLRGISISPEGKLVIVSVGGDVQASIWDVESGKQAVALVHFVHAGQGGVLAVTLSTDGKYLATATQDKYARLWALPSGKLLKEMHHSAAITAVAFTRDGRYLITGTEDKAASVWDTKTGLRIASLHHEGRVTALAVSPDGKWLATISQIAPSQTVVNGAFSKVTLWSDFADKQPESFSVGPPGESISAISFADEKRLATVASERAVKIWDVELKRQLLQIPRQGTRDIRTLAFSADGNRVAIAGSDNRVTVWNALNGAESFVLSGHSRDIIGIAFSLDGKRLATASLDGTVKSWGMLPGNELMDLPRHDDVIYRVAFNVDGSKLATASWDKTAGLWDAATGRELRVLAGHTDRVTGVAFSPDGKRVATCSADRRAKIWDASSGKELFTLIGHTDQVMAVAFSRDGTRLATASWDKTVKIWEANSGKEVLELRGHTDHVEDVAFSRDGKWLASASADKSARIWDASTGKQQLRLSGHLYWVLGVAFSADSKQLATASADRTVKIWEIPSGKPVITLVGHTGMVRNVAFSPDGRRVATASEDNTARIWDASSGDRLFTLSEHTDKVFGIALSPNRLATAGADRRVLMYAWGGEEIMKLARTRITRPVTFNECREYNVHSEQCTAAQIANPWLEKGRERAASGDVKAAIAAFQEAKRLDPRSISFDPQTEATSWAVHSLIAAGEARANSGEVDSAVASFRAAKQLDPTSISFDPQARATSLAAQNKVAEGRTQASSGDLSGAIAAFREAKKLDPSSISFDPRAEANRIAAAAKKSEAQHLIAEAQIQATSGDLDSAKPILEEARKLDPSFDASMEANRLAAEHFVAEGDTLLRNDDVKKAEEAYGAGIAAYGRVPALDPDGSKRAEVWNTICLQGSLRGHSAAVMDSCERAIKEAEQLPSGSWNARGSRGVARALTGNSDGAIEDFQFFVDHTPDTQNKEQRQQWIAALRSGQNPFTPDVLNSLSGP